MKRILLAIALSGSFIGCSKKDGIVLFGVMLGDDAENAPKGEMVAEGSYRYKHTPELNGEWNCFYDVRDGLIVSVSGLCSGDVDLQENFEACREWIKQNVPYTEITNDGEHNFSTYSDTVSSSCSIYHGTLSIRVALLGDVKKRIKEHREHDLSK